MRTIYKYALEVVDLQVLQLPAGSQILSVGNQQGKLCLWAMVETTLAPQGRKIRICGTGNYIGEPPGAFIGTVQQHDGALVWHVFDAGVVVDLTK